MVRFGASAGLKGKPVLSLNMNERPQKPGPWAATFSQEEAIYPKARQQKTESGIRPTSVFRLPCAHSVPPRLPTLFILLHFPHGIYT